MMITPDATTMLLLVTTVTLAILVGTLSGWLARDGHHRRDP